MKKEEISLKNTKAEILEALNEALEREKKLSEMKSDPIKAENKKKVEIAVEETKKNVENNIFSEELNNKYKNLELAIVKEEEKLKELYGIENELANLTMIMNAGKDLLNNLEEKKKKETERVENEVQELEKNYEDKKKQLERENDIYTRNVKLERERETEEYNYKTKRERELDKNKWEDEKKNRETALKEKEQETQRLLNDAKEQEKYIKDLEEKVSKIPETLQLEYNRGKEETTTELKKEQEYKEKLLIKDYQSQIDRQSDKIESLTKELEYSKEENKSLQEKLDKSYLEMKELATKTVEANGGVKILGNNNQDNK